MLKVLQLNMSVVLLTKLVFVFFKGSNYQSGGGGTCLRSQHLEALLGESLSSRPD